MRALFGFLQFALGIGGLIALFNGQFLSMIAAWLGAFLVGWVGNRIVRGLMGVSQSGQDAIPDLRVAMRELSQEKFSSAEGSSRAAVSAFRAGGDKALLPVALLVSAVALGANAKFDLARKAIDESEHLLRTGSPRLQEANGELLPVVLQIQRELHAYQPSSPRLVAHFHEWNQS